jgi:hypothetical protein
MVRRFAKGVLVVGVLVLAALFSACARDVAQRRDDGATLPAQARCITDADCRLVSDYCDGCACRALATGEADPTCGGTIVQCFVDPCQRRRAVCQSGACAAVTS